MEGQNFLKGSEEMKTPMTAVLAAVCAFAVFASRPALAQEDESAPETPQEQHEGETGAADAIPANEEAETKDEQEKTGEKKEEAQTAELEIPDGTAAADGGIPAHRRISTRVFTLSHVSAEEVAAHFNATWSGDFGAAWKISEIARAFPEANAVMVTAPLCILDACEDVVRRIDRETQQVYIEARFVELGNTASHKLGIDWSMLDGMKASVSVGGGYNSTHVGKGVSDYSRNTYGTAESISYNINGADSSNGDITYFNGTLNFSELALTLQALEATDDARIFSNPKIIVSSGKKATVDMTTKYPNVFVSAKRTNSGQNINSLDLSMQISAIPGEDKFMFAKEAFFSWGIQLDVVPRVGADGLINVTIVPTISDLDTNYGNGGFVDAANAGETEATYSSRYPIIKVQRLITEFNMASGATAVIGGLSRTVETQRDTGIPFLRNIPWAGKLFGSKVRVKEQREILVFVTVGLVDPKAMNKDAGLPKNAVLGRQYITGARMEPGDRPADEAEGLQSLDLRTLDEQAQDAAAQKPSAARP